MNKIAQKLKNIIKKPSEPTSYGKNPMDPWSARADINEGSLDQYLKAKGINPEFVSKDMKISHAKSLAFQKWKREHQTEEVIPEMITTEPGLTHKKKAETQKSVHAHKEIKTPRGPGSHHEAKGSQMTALTPESVQMDESPKEGGKKKFSGMYNPAPKGTFAYDQAMRKKKHDEIEKQQSKDGSGMTAAIDRLQKHMNKEETELDEMDQKFVDSLNKLSHTHKVGDSVTVDSKFFGKQKGKVTKVDNQSIHVQRDGKKFSEKYPHDAVVKEEVTQAEVDKFHKKLDKLVHHTFGKSSDEKKMKEDVGDAKAAVNADGLPNPQLEPVSEKKRQMSKSARMIKALYKKKGMVKEDMYDHEKEDKSVATYGKKPKMEKSDKDESIGEKKPQAALTLTGGKTLTGTERDTVEIDPMMRNRPGQPDVTKKDDKKDDKKKDEKKDK
jgi:hypothetical protein